MMVDLSVGEIHLLIEALARAAGRHETEARAKPRAAWAHERKADAMHQLRQKLLESKKEGRRW